MVNIHKSFLVSHNAAKMFEVVNDVESYPKFLPWCNKTEIIKSEDNILHARLYVDYLAVKQKFATRNVNVPGKEIKIFFLEGPFKHLEGRWTFIDISKNESQVKFNLNYEFSNFLLSKIIGPIFHIITNGLVHAFIEEADERYGT